MLKFWNWKIRRIALAPGTLRTTSSCSTVPHVGVESLIPVVQLEADGSRPIDARLLHIRHGRTPRVRINGQCGDLVGDVVEIQVAREMPPDQSDPGFRNG